ncbi:hypothetical protein MACJ_003588 [Theileria orientalis]|uniref:Uncharacterized protein n=1 Tax=Theileria orientalis TaxID=68886 RepID=A0A976SLB3_THEOR|nr:hypothetical protein MACJ_003588 [Theileria orientalis]
MWYKYNSSTPERSCIYENLGVVGIATLFLLIVYLWLRVYPNERLKLASDLFPSGSVVEFLRVHGVYVIQLTMVMATVLGWATIEAEVFTSVDTTGKIHGLLFLTKFLSPVPLIVQYHPEHDIQDGILVLALLNAFCVILLTLLLHSKAQSASRISLKPIPPRSRRMRSDKTSEDD